MAIIPCPECGQNISDAVGECPVCGHPMRPAAPPTGVQTQQQSPRHALTEKSVSTGNGLQKHVSTPMGCLFVFLLMLAIWFVSALVSNAPVLQYVFAFLGLVLIAGLIANRPEGIREYVSEGKLFFTVGGLILIIGSIIGGNRAADTANDQQLAAEQQERERSAAEERAREAAAREAELRANAGTAAAALQETTNRLLAATQAENGSEMEKVLSESAQRAEPYERLTGLPPEMAAALSSAAAARSSAKDVLATRDLVSRAEQHLRSGTAQQANGHFLEAKDSFTAAIQLLQQIPSDNTRYARERNRLLVQGKALALRVTARADRQRKTREREQAEVKRQEAARAELARLCGPVPEHSERTGSYFAVMRYLEHNAPDPDSIEVTGCAQAVLTDKCWLTECSYRGKNAFGALTRQSGVFWMQREAVIAARQDR